jgi:flagellar hook assembly protein FlgD
MGALGKTVLAAGNQVVIPESGDAQVHVNVGGTGGLATLRIYNEAGQEVGSREIGAVGGGRQTIELGSAGEKLKPGKYTYEVEVVDGGGSKVATQPFISARIDGIRYGPDGPVLTAGSMTIPFGSIVEILTGSD